MDLLGHKYLLMCRAVKGVSPVYEDSGVLAYDNDTSLDIAYPSTVNDGDILVLMVYANGSKTISLSGWNLISSEEGFQMSVSYYWKRADGTETGTVTVGVSSYTTITGAISRYSGCLSTGTPYTDLTTYTELRSYTHSISGMIGTGLAIYLFFIETEDTDLPSNPSNYISLYNHYNGSQVSSASGKYEASGSSPADSIATTGERTHIGLSLIFISE